MPIAEELEELLHAQESSELHYLPGDVAEDFREALTCCSGGCWNAFAAICRRCLQSAAVLLETMRDVLYQLFVRQAKIEEATALRQQAIAGGSSA